MWSAGVGMMKRIAVPMGWVGDIVYDGIAGFPGNLPAVATSLP